TYMTYSSDTSTEAPTLDLPLANATIPTDFTVQYDQPETAYEGSVKITLTRTSGSLDSGSPHILEVESEASGTDITINMKGAGLGGATGVSLYDGGNALVDDAVYTIKIEYQDLAQNTAASDENAGITYDTSDLIEIAGGDYNAGTSFSPGSTNNAFFRIQMNKTGSGQNATVDSIYFDILGSFDGSDIDAIRIWRSTNNSFESGTDTQLISDTSSPFDPFTVKFSTPESIGSTTVYYFLTVDVSSGADGTDAIGASIDYASWVDASLTVTGTFPITGSTHPLPVTLSSFTVVLSGQPVIYWTTQSETNNAYWNIYRGISQNLGQAIQINDGDMILGQGTSTEPTDYSYIDNYPILENTTYWYWLECVDNAGEADILGPVSLFVPEGIGNNGTPATPDDYGLKQNYPNPFNPDTKINFALVEDSPVRLTIYNIKGEKIKTIFDDFVSADMVQTAYWDGKDESGKKVASGVYLYRLRTNKTEFNRRMLLMK
ncbi:MAG: T9SS type A sorting domain-containing protein, partial [Candidatus Cloacimonadota bacterium]|nr:T9SS type A sorting domain-containing protein [Candidatus Cloacimonadota bacterium]